MIDAHSTPWDVPWSDHLVALVAQAEAAAARLEFADPRHLAVVAADARRAYARASARLDASPLEDSTAAEVDVHGPPVRVAPADGVGRDAGAEDGSGWARALKLDGMATQDVAAVEYANLLAAADLEPQIAEVFFSDPLDALAQLHGVVAAGLVAPAIVGRPRRSEQAIHDGAQGRVVYHPAAPEALPALLQRLAAWLRTDSAGLPALVVAGVAQERILEWQPFEAANGRVARAASRVILRARGLDPWGVAVPERFLGADPLAYYSEVAATIRRGGDLGLWLERYGEALVAAFEAAAADLVPRAAPDPPARAVRLHGELRAGETITVAEYAQRAGVPRAVAHHDLRMLVRAGVLAPDTRTRGLRYRRPA